MSWAVLFDRLGGPEVLRLEEVTVGEPGEDEVRVAVEAIGLNRGEALFRCGGYLYQPTFPASRLGMEAAGVVEAVGAAVAGFAPGDRVSILGAGINMSTHGVYGDRVIVPAYTLLHRPDSMDAVTGAAVWMPYLTAYGALIEEARIRPGDNVVITAASSSVGVAAIQIANQIGANPIAVTRTSAKTDQLLRAGAAHVIASEEGDLVKRVQAVTDGRGAELVFDAIAGPGLTELATTVAYGGLLIVYGWLDTRPAPLPLNWPIKIEGFAVYAVTHDNATLRRGQAFINAGLRSGGLVPVIDRSFDLADMVAAHQYMESNSQIGKIIVTVQH